MKLRLPRLVLALSLVGAALSVQADDFCMDCTERTRYFNGVPKLQALCCMADDDGDCFGGYTMAMPNVGAQCLIVEQPNGETICGQNASIDSGCEGGGGPGGGNGGGGMNDDPNNCSGYAGACPAWCYNCL